MEQDVAKYCDQDGVVRVAKIPSIDNDLQTQYRRACVDVRVYTPNPVSETISDEVLIIHVNGDNLTRDDENISQYVVNRNSPLSSNTFWSILTVGAFRCIQSGYLGVHRSDYNALFIFNDVIEESSVTVTAKRNILMHELGHALGLEDEFYASKTEPDSTITVMWATELEESWSFSLEELRQIQRFSYTR